jgi:hypothetical protein
VLAGDSHPLARRLAERKLDVLLRRQPREQRVALEDHAAVATGCEDLLAGDEHLSLGLLLQAGDDREQRRLAAAAGADHGHELLLGDVEVDAVERDKLARAILEHLAHAAHRELPVAHAHLSPPIGICAYPRTSSPDP